MLSKAYKKEVDANGTTKIYETLWGDNEVMDDNDVIELFDQDGNQVQVGGSTEIKFSIIAANWDIYGNYYRISVNDLKVINNFARIGSGTTEDPYKLYGYNGAHVIDGVRVKLVDGSALRKYDSWIKNKYLSGTSENNFYTRYKYSNLGIFRNRNSHIEYTYIVSSEPDKDSNGSYMDKFIVKCEKINEEWHVTKYAYLVPEGNNRLPNDSNTILIESVQLTLGSPKTIYKENTRYDSSKYTPTGSFALSKPGS